MEVVKAYFKVIYPNICLQGLNKAMKNLAV
jgi:hypothetical protein